MERRFVLGKIIAQVELVIRESRSVVTEFCMEIGQPRFVPLRIRFFESSDL